MFFLTRYTSLVAVLKVLLSPFFMMFQHCCTSREGKAKDVCCWKYLGSNFKSSCVELHESFKKSVFSCFEIFRVFELQHVWFNQCTNDLPYITSLMPLWTVIISVWWGIFSFVSFDQFLEEQEIFHALTVSSSNCLQASIEIEFWNTNFDYAYFVLQ